MTNKVILGLALMLVLVVPATSLPVMAQSTTALNAAGATFPFPLIDKWRVEYAKLHPDVSLNYQSIGSGAGIKLFTQKAIDFAASDAPLQTSEAAAAPGTLHIPETIGAVTVSYNMPGISKGLKLTGSVIADIFTGKITKWSDKQITDLNPTLTLPDQSIVVAHRSDGSGTTFVFTSYLSAVSPNWKTSIGAGKSVQWPVGVGGQGNARVANIVKTTQYSIGYVELAYVMQNNMTYAFVQNADGTDFIEPTLATISADAGSATLPSSDGDWSQVSIVNQPGKDSYPISSFTYLLVYKDLSQVNGMTQEKAKAVVDFLNWAIHDGQQFSSDLLYVPLPDAVVKKDEQAISSIAFTQGAVPEFGPMSSIILVIAVASIIAISVKGRLGLQFKP
ncbi:PBP superfamily domain protein [uncultured archaeon]|nr:PBP superfamily domain protein [uncultured archaeon]